MKNKFTLGAISGITSLLVAVPIIAQVSSAATASTTTSASASARPAPTTAQIQEMITRDEKFLTNIDAMISVQKAATTAHKAALTAALSITDDAQRQAAVKKANEDHRAAIEAAIKANPDLKSAMPMGGPGKGGQMGMKGGQGGQMGAQGERRGPPAELLSALGMTKEELKAAIESGKTIEQIASSKNVTLPERPDHPPMGGGMGVRMDGSF